MKFWLLFPAVVLFALFIAWPLGMVAFLSLHKTNFITTSFVALQNYRDLFASSEFYSAISNSLFYMAIIVPFNVLLSIFISFLLLDLPKKWIDTSRILLYLPVLSAGLIISQAWKWIFHQDGLLNWILGNLGLEKIFWFSQGITAIPAISMVAITSALGANVILTLASMESVDKSLVEAARIDGATQFQINTRIILPLIMPTITLISMLAAISALQIIETPMALAPQEFAATPAYSIYRIGFLFGNYGVASAYAVILVAATAFLTGLKNVRS